MGGPRAHAAATAFDADRLARGRSAVHALDPRAKTLAALVLVVAGLRIAPGEAWKLAAFAAAVAAAAAAAGLPARFLVTRTAIALPLLSFFVVTAPLLPGPLAENLLRAGLTVAKALFSVLAVTVLVATTPWHRLLQGLERLRVPRALVLVLHFLHRYLFVLVEEVTAMRRARDARLTRRPTLAGSLAAGSGIIGGLFIRTLERAERIEAAMASRGFTGEVRTLERPRFALRDGAALAAVSAFAVLVSRA